MKKSSLKAIKGALSRDEMKKIFGGSGGCGVTCSSKAGCGELCRCNLSTDTCYGIDDPMPPVMMPSKPVVM